MEPQIFAMVLIAALCHACWNALVKGQGDRLVVMTIMNLSAGAVSLAAIPFVALPDPAAWPYILASVVLHTGYVTFLLLAYRKGDLSHVYPFARGLAPLLVFLASVTVIGEALSREGMLAVGIIGLGIMSLAFTRGAAGFREPAPVVFAVITACFIAAYTVVDGLGARLAGSPHGYTAWLFFLDAIPLAVITLSAYRGRALALARRRWKAGALGGVLSLIAYWLVIWALTEAPMAYVSALRETSIAFAVILGVVVLKERLDLFKLAAVATTMIGTAVLRLSR